MCSVLFSRCIHSYKLYICGVFALCIHHIKRYKHIALSGKRAKETATEIENDDDEDEKKLRIQF